MSDERLDYFKGPEPIRQEVSFPDDGNGSDAWPYHEDPEPQDWVAEECPDVAGEQQPEPRLPNLAAVRPRRRMERGRRLIKPAGAEAVRGTLNAEQRLLILNAWLRSDLPAGDFAPLVGVSKHTLYSWRKRFDDEGPAGLMDKPRGGPKGSRLNEVTKRSILMMKESHPDWGVQRISDLLARGPALAASPGTVAKVLHEAGYECQEHHHPAHRDKIRHFERARPNQLWQTDLFTFVLKRTNRRVHLVGFMDDHSRFIVSYGLHATASTAMVIEVFRSGIASYGPPEEVLTDNGPQYVTWRGKSQFSKECEARGVRQIIARPRHPQTLGKIERFWGTLWRECVETAVFADLNDAQVRIGHFIDHYNFQRPHQGIDGLVPADRFFASAPTVLSTLKERVAENAASLARDGVPRQPLYLTGNLAGKAFSIHGEGDRLVLREDGASRREITLGDVPVATSMPAPATVAGTRLPDPALSGGIERPPGVSAVAGVTLSVANGGADYDDPIVILEHDDDGCEVAVDIADEEVPR